MSNSVNDSIKLIDSQLANIEKRLSTNLTQIVDISKAARELSNLFSESKSPSGVSKTLKESKDNTEQLNALLKEQNKLEKNLISTQAKKELATESTNRAVIKERYELQQQNKLIKEAAILSSNYSTLLQKTTVERNKLARVIQDLNLKKSLGNKLSKDEQKELKESTKQFDKYNKSIKEAKESVGRFQENVGNYPEALSSVKDLVTGLVSSFGIIEGLGLVFDFSQEALELARDAKGVEFAFKRLGYEGVEAFENIKQSTRGLISDLEIKKSINEFENFNINLEQTDVLFEFLAVRAAQTGKSVDSLRDSLVEGLSKESKLRIDNLGISMAELNSELEKAPDFVTAVANIAKTEIAEAGSILDDTASSQVKFNVAFENFKLSAGSGFIGELTNEVYGLGESFLSAFSDINTASDGFFDFINNAYLYSKGMGVVVQAEAAFKTELSKRKPIIEEIISLQEAQGVIELQLLKNREEYIKTNSEDLKLLLKSLKTKEEEIKVVEKTVAFYRLKNQELKEEQETLTILDLKRSKAIKNEIKNNEDLIKSILLLNESTNERNKAIALSIKLNQLNNESLKGTKEELKTILDYYKSTDNLELPELDTSSIEQFASEMDRLVTDDMIAQMDFDLLTESFDDLSQTIQEQTGINAEVLSNFFDKIRQKGITSFEDIGEVASASFDVMGEISNAYYDSKIEKYDQDIDANNEYYENLLDNENLSDEEAKRLEADRAQREEILRKKQAKEKKKQAEADKAFSVAKIIIDTATAVTEALPNIPLSIAVGALGAVQIATVLGTPIPEFAEGGTMKDDGLMKINDHHSGRLELVERKGNLYMTTKKDAIVKGEKGDIIHKDAKKYFDNLSDGDLMENINYHSVIASLSNNMRLASVYENRKTVDNNNANTDRLIKVIKAQKTRFNVHNNLSLGDDISFLSKLNDV